MNEIERRYFDEDHWETVDEQTARRILSRYYADVELALSEIKAGETIQTPNAFYRLERAD